ncbi:outer membrane beta-barrel protein [Flammeovirga kamogawensis]|uniref:Porin family protein n=1 Tax=Flammeovirga kamogawensis TaxID=373891 RepID=A0ABX8GTK5_9BACT|nr:outer membrane beta-barrel protein [Flammeovirga kamogawensis]MBB6460027.1 outer membrane protein W [Flammeovirga kamogawensis]QWG06925.1 porin family protein [Flammeovirga kamogawensis]TRX68746.1 porin family protein [Flammeovirga kamogawensis]
MKKTIIVALFLAMCSTAFAQDKKFSIGFGLGGSFASSKFEDVKQKGAGVNGFLNFYYNVNSKLSLGLEYNGATIVIKPEDDMGINFEATGLSSFSAKGLYHFSENKVRPYAGIGLGLYNVSPGKIGSGENFIEFEKASSFGFAPEVGLKLGWFQIAALYHMIPSVSFSDDYNPSYNNFEIRIAANIGLVSN